MNKRGKKRMPLSRVLDVGVPTKSRKQAVIPRRTNKMSRMTARDIREMNEVSKSTRGLSNIKRRDIFGED